MPDEQPPIVPPAAAPKKRKKLTKREEAISRSVVKNPNGTLVEHANTAGYSDDTVAWKTLQKDHVKDRIRQLMERHKDTSLEGLHKTLAAGLKASEVKFFQHEGKVTDKRVTVDHGTRHRYLETALEMHGALDKDKGGNVTNNFFTKDAMEAFVDAFKNKGVAAAQVPVPPAIGPGACGRPNCSAGPTCTGEHPEADGHGS